jgi:hypothetical protein
MGSSQSQFISHLFYAIPKKTRIHATAKYEKTEISIPAGLQEKIHCGKTQTNGIVRTWRKSAKTVPFKL